MQNLSEPLTLREVALKEVRDQGSFKERVLVCVPVCVWCNTEISSTCQPLTLLRWRLPLTLGAVFPGVALIANAAARDALPPVAAVVGAGALRAAGPGEALVAHALAIQALAAQVTVARALGLRAVGAFPAGFAHAAAAFRAEVAPSAAEGPGVHAACREENRVSL